MLISENLLMSAELRRTPLKGVYELISQPFVDARGCFFNAFLDRYWLHLATLLGSEQRLWLPICVIFD